MISQFENRLWKCSTGAVAVMTALVFPVLLGFTSLGVEVGHWYLDQREMQGAADAAAFSAAADVIVKGVTGTTYQTVGVNYATLNGFTIPTANVCLVTGSGDNCGTVRSLDSRAILCPTTTNNSGGTTTTWACVVVEITQNTATWLTTKESLEPGPARHLVQAIPTPTLKARSVVKIKVVTTPPTTTAGSDCILALANSTSAVQVSGSKADLQGECGVAIDGGIDQNPGTPVGGITFNGSGAKVNITSLTVAGSSAGGCPSSSHCFLFNPSTSPLSVTTNTPTSDPFTAALDFTDPLGVNAVAIAAAGSGYPKNATCTFTISGGTYFVTGTPSPVTFTATTNKNGQISGITLTDPGAYTVLPTLTGATATTTTCASGFGAKFNLTAGCFNQPATIIAGRTYCSISLSGNFPPGNYYTTGNITGTGNTGATAIASGATPPGVTFYQSGGGSISITGNANYNLCAPGTVTSGNQCNQAYFATPRGCDKTAGSCLLFVQKATLPGSATTVNDFSGNQTSVFSGVVYIPDETFRSGGTGTVLGCFGVVAQYVLVQGTPTFSNGCLPANIGGTTIPGTITASSPTLYQ